MTRISMRAGVVGTNGTSPMYATDELGIFPGLLGGARWSWWMSFYRRPGGERRRVPVGADDGEDLAEKDGCSGGGKPDDGRPGYDTITCHDSPGWCWAKDPPPERVTTPTVFLAK
jgi:hypothetical protein